MNLRRIVISLLDTYRYYEPITQLPTANLSPISLVIKLSRNIIFNALASGIGYFIGKST